MGSIFKRVCACLLAFVMTIGFAACGGPQGDTPEQAVKNMLEAIKTGDREKASQYIDYDQLFSGTEEDGSAQDEEMAKLLFSQMSYTVLSSSGDQQKATVSAQITNIDMAQVLGELFAEILKLAFSGSDETQMEEQTMEIFKELLQKDGAATVTSDVTFQLEKKDNVWKISLDDTAIDAFLGGLISASKALGESLQPKA